MRPFRASSSCTTPPSDPGTVSANFILELALARTKRAPIGAGSSASGASVAAGLTLMGIVSLRPFDDLLRNRAAERLPLL
jgi:hypothetical protein